MKPSENCSDSLKIVETVAIVEVELPLPEALKTGLGYAAAPWWISGDRLYILNCALADATILCGNAGKEEFVWGKWGAALGKYRLAHGKATFFALATDEAVPTDYINHALPVHNRQELMAALDESRTFRSRAHHRGAAAKE